MVLATLGLAMVALGIWVGDRAAVAAPLVILGALILVAAVLFEGWAETIEEVSVTQSGVTFKRQLPSAEELSQAGLLPEVAQEITAWTEDLTGALPGVIDARVRKILDDRAASERHLQQLAREFVERRHRAERDEHERD